MPVILTEPYEPTARSLAIMDVVMMIDRAMTGDEEVDVYDLAEEIVDRLQPPARSGLPLAAIKGWQDRLKVSAAAEPNVIAIDRVKPHIRVRAATQHTA